MYHGAWTGVSMGQCHQLVSDQESVVVTLSEVTPPGRAGQTSAFPSTSRMLLLACQNSVQNRICFVLMFLTLQMMGASSWALLVHHGFLMALFFWILPLPHSYGLCFYSPGSGAKPSHFFFFSMSRAFPHWHDRLQTTTFLLTFFILPSPPAVTC